MVKVDVSGLTNMRYRYVMQYNQSDWEFLWARAQLFGYQVYADGKMLNFVKADAISDDFTSCRPGLGPEFEKV
jgi:phage protein D